MPAPKKLTQQGAKDAVISAVAQGATIGEALLGIGYSRKTHDNWRADDPEYCRRLDEVKLIRKTAIDRGNDPDVAELSFADWRQRYLLTTTYPHQQNWVDILEGREPSWLHPSMIYEPGDPSRVLINTPPAHSKTMTVTIDWVTRELCLRPWSSTIVVSKTQTMAKDFLYAIKQRLTSPRYAALQAAYGGSDGFKASDGSWTADRIYLDSALRDNGEKDPSVQAIGMGGQIYGARANTIIVDDAVVLSNANDYEKQIRWLIQEVASRLPAVGGRLIVIGTRVAPTDLYQELMNEDRYITGKSPWTYFASPAVLEFAEKPENWVTLWPKAAIPFPGDTTPPDEDGEYPRWDGHNLNRVRNQIPSREWALTYQQQGVDEDATFSATCVMGSIDRRRKPGPLKAGAWGHPRNGAEGMQTIMSVDPAGTGEAFVLIEAVDRPSKKRYILQAWSERNTTPSWYADLLEASADLYGIQHLVIEQNAYASWLIHDERITAYCRDKGIRMIPHFTGRQKQDPDFGVPSLAPLFGGIKRHVDGGRPDHDGNNLIELPDPDMSPGIKALIEQLIAWQPKKNARQLRMDGPMAMWFAELVARTIINSGERKTSFIDNPYLSRGDRAERRVIPVDFMRYA